MVLHHQMTSLHRVCGTPWISQVPSTCFTTTDSAAQWWEMNQTYNTIQCITMQYNTIQYKTIQYDAMHYLNVIVQVFARFGKISGRVWLSHCLYTNGVTKQALISSRIEQEPARLHVHHPWPKSIFLKAKISRPEKRHEFIRERTTHQFPALGRPCTFKK